MMSAVLTRSNLKDKRTAFMIDDDDVEENDNVITILHVQNQQVMDNKQRSGQYTGSIDTSTNKPHCKNDFGKMIYDNDHHLVYEGQWNMGNWSGIGTLVDNITDEIYKGEFVNNQKHGQGTITYPDGRVYNGSFCEDKMEKGIMTFPDNSTYWGYWRTKYERPSILRQNHSINDGTTTSSNSNNKTTIMNQKRKPKNKIVVTVVPHGRGKYSYADGSVYDGEFMDGIRYGHGRMIWPDGRWYLGDWSRGKQHGDGIEVDGTNNNGKVIYCGKFEHGEPAPDAKAKKRKYNKMKKNENKKKNIWSRMITRSKQQNFDSSMTKNDNDTIPVLVYPQPLSSSLLPSPCRGRLIGQIPSATMP